jgi:hypothetical protein
MHKIFLSVISQWCNKKKKKISREARVSQIAQFFTAMDRGFHAFDRVSIVYNAPPCRNPSSKRIPSRPVARPHPLLPFTVASSPASSFTSGPYLRTPYQACLLPPSPVPRPCSRPAPYRRPRHVAEARSTRPIYWAGRLRSSLPAESYSLRAPSSSIRGVKRRCRLPS